MGSHVTLKCPWRWAGCMLWVRCDTAPCAPARACGDAGPLAGTCASPAPLYDIVPHMQHHGAAAHRYLQFCRLAECICKLQDLWMQHHGAAAHRHVQVGRAGSWRRRRGWRPRPTWRACAAWAPSTWLRCGCGWTAPCGRGRHRTSWRALTPASAPPCSTSARCRWPAARARPAESLSASCPPHPPAVAMGRRALSSVPQPAAQASGPSAPTSATPHAAEAPARGRMHGVTGACSAPLSACRRRLRAAARRGAARAAG